MVEAVIYGTWSCGVSFGSKHYDACFVDRTSTGYLGHGVVLRSWTCIHRLNKTEFLLSWARPRVLYRIWYLRTRRCPHLSQVADLKSMFEHPGLGPESYNGFFFT
jgi:hypothetical protein